MSELAVDGLGNDRLLLGPGLNPAERRTFVALAFGHLLFAAALFTVAKGLGENAIYYLTPLFGLPLLLVAPRERIAARAFVVLIGFAAVHYGATAIAQQSYAFPFTGDGFTSSEGLCGAIGGAIGAVGSFGLCALLGLLRPRPYVMLAVGTLVLSGLGGLGVTLWLMEKAPEAIAPMLWLYTPWQLAFAYFLAKTLKP